MSYPYRTTLDLDLLRDSLSDGETLRKEFKEICETQTEADGLKFDPDSVRVETIREDQEYEGQRVHLVGYLGKAKTQIQIDVGMGDAPWPKPVSHNYPTLLEFPAPELQAYERESVIAEKLEAMVELGIANSRIKDFFDVHHLAMKNAFDGATLSEAIRRTMARRKTPFPADVPIALTAEFWEAEGRSQHILAFARRARIKVDQKAACELSPLLRAFVWPPLSALSKGKSFKSQWPKGGPWS